MMCLFVWVDLKNAADTVVMIPLLYKLFFVRYRVSLDEILELRKVRCEQYTASHDGKTLARDLPGLAQLFDQDRKARATYTIAVRLHSLSTLVSYFTSAHVNSL